ncbi:hypothetical protein FOXYSP1_01296 [Fusarium oxysporum f. sp. phaseoli]
MIPRLCTCFTALNLHELGNMGVGRVQSGQFKLQLGNMMSGPSKPPSWGGGSPRQGTWFFCRSGISQWLPVLRPTHF